MRSFDDPRDEPTADERPGRAARWSRWFQPMPAEVVGLVVLLLGAVVASTLWWWQAVQRPEADVALSAGPGAVVAPDGEVDGPAPGADPRAASEDRASGPEPAESRAEVTVHVSGAVGSPGLVTLRAGSRAGDAVAVAGGLLPQADPAGINLARELLDGDHVHVPREGEVLPPSSDPSSGSDRSDPIDLNTASEAALEELPGVGPARATAIVEHRREHGPFTVPGDLRDVAGIGEATFQRLAELVTVR